MIEDAETILQFDNVVAMTLRELGATPGSIGELIVRDRQEQIAQDHALKAIAVAVLAIGLGLVTFGGGDSRGACRRRSAHPQRGPGR